MGVRRQNHAPAALPAAETAYPLCRRLGRPQGRPGRVRKISPSHWIRSPDRQNPSESLYRLRNGRNKVEFCHKENLNVRVFPKKGVKIFLFPFRLKL